MRTSWFLVFIVFFTLFSNGQTGSVKGFVYDKATGEPAPFLSVYFKGTQIGASTDLNGFFNISRIPPGDYLLLITSLDFDTIKESISIKPDVVLNKKYFASKEGLRLEEVEVTTSIAEKIENTSVGINKIDPVKINKLPSVGEPDVAQYLQVLPGVVVTGDQGGQLYVRGGLPVQNKVLLDGMILYNPFHSLGLFSVFDNDIMKSADVYSAGFGAEYGGRTSSVMDFKTRDGNKKRTAGKVSLSTFSVKANLEGPFKKLTDNGNTSASYVFSIKHSILPTTSKALYSYANPNGLPFYYTDTYGKVSLNSTGGSKISVFGFNFTDKVDYSNVASFAWKNLGAGANFLLVPHNSNLLIEGYFCYSTYRIDFKNPTLESDSKFSTVGGANAGFNFVKFAGNSEWRYGIEGVITNTQYQVTNPFFAVINMRRSTTDVAAFLKPKFKNRKKTIVFEPSFRLQYYATLGYVSPEPRAALKINFTRKIRFKAAGGLYSQTLISANSDRDIVNLFYGFINAPESQDISPTYLDRNGKTVDVNSAIQKSWHGVGGFEFDLFKHIEVNVEVYQKLFKQIVNINRDKVFEDNSTNESRPDELKKTFTVEQGRARGFDLTIKYDRKNFYFWAVYSLTLNDRWSGSALTGSITNYPPNFDRRHNVNLVTSYNFGKKKNWEINGRWNFGTGFPFTQTQGYINQLNPQGNLNYNYSNANGTLNFIPAELNGGRLPTYHRFDIGMKYKYKWNDKTSFEIGVGATNVYNRDNIFYIDRFTFARINQLPILPNLTMSLTF